jgi:hypothetical protein
MLASGGVAELRRLCYHHVQHRRQIAARAVDDLQHLGGRGLLRDGLGELELKVGDDLLGIGCGIVQSHNLLSNSYTLRRAPANSLRKAMATFQGVAAPL